MRQLSLDIIADDPRDARPPTAPGQQMSIIEQMSRADIIRTCQLALFHEVKMPAPPARA